MFVVVSNPSIRGACVYTHKKQTTHEVEEEVVGVGAEALGEEHGGGLVLVAVAEEVREDDRHLYYWVLCVRCVVSVS